jgi:mannobiose 2-epimerase
VPDHDALKTLKNQTETELRSNILPFWLNHTRDTTRGGFYGEISNDLQIDEDAPRGALLTARILWTFASAYSRYRESAYLAMAEHAFEDLLNRFWDSTYGGLYWMVAADGTPLRPRKQIYGQAFGIYALAEYYAATGEPTALNKAQVLFELLDEHAYDPEHKGYLEAYTREWTIADDMRLSAIDENEKKSMNTHIHIMEAFTNLLRVWSDPQLKARHTELLEVMMTRIIDPATSHTILFFDEAWTPRSANISYGHDIETSWLLVEAAEILGDDAILSQTQPLAVKMAQAVYDEGRDPDGAVLYEGGPEGWVDDTKQWWPQAEAAVGFLNAFQLTGADHFFKAAERSWAFIQAYLIDREYGGWYRYVTREHQHDPASPKVSFWKAPYHNGRACMELTDRLSGLLPG